MSENHPKCDGGGATRSVPRYEGREEFCGEPTLTVGHAQRSGPEIKDGK